MWPRDMLTVEGDLLLCLVITVMEHCSLEGYSFGILKYVSKWRETEKGHSGVDNMHG